MSVMQIRKHRDQHAERPEFIRVVDRADLQKLREHLEHIAPYSVFKLVRDHAGHPMHFLGSNTIKGRNRGKCSKGRIEYVKAHTAIWFATDELEEAAFPIVDERCMWEVNKNVRS